MGTEAGGDRSQGADGCDEFYLLPLPPCCLHLALPDIRQAALLSPIPYRGPGL